MNLGDLVTVSLSDAEPFKAQIVAIQEEEHGNYYQVETRLGRKNWVSEYRITLVPPQEITIMLHMTIPADAEAYEIARDIVREIPRITYNDCTVDDYEIPSDR